MEQKYSSIADIGNLEVRFDEPMKLHTTFGIGGNVDVYAIPRTNEAFESLVNMCEEFQSPYRIIGNGSNILVKDEGSFGVVIDLTLSSNYIDVCGNELLVGAGVKLGSIVSMSEERGLSGIEFASGMPGTIGGAIVNNSSAFGGWISDVLSEVIIFDSKVGQRMIPKDELGFEYRKSGAKGLGIIVGARIKLTPDKPPNVRLRVRKVIEERKSKQPFGVKCAGCIFKNPEGESAGKILDSLGLKGFRVGGAMISETHANFIVNTGGATCVDVDELIDVARERVMKKWGIELELEVEIWGKE